MGKRPRPPKPPQRKPRSDEPYIETGALSDRALLAAETLLADADLTMGGVDLRTAMVYDLVQIINRQVMTQEEKARGVVEGDGNGGE